MKYFMEEEFSEMVYTLDYFKSMIDEDLKEIKLLEMKRDYGGEMWCKENQEFIERGDCGYFCIHYHPCNGKNGRCRYLENDFIGTGRKFLLTKDGLKIKEFPKGIER